jgi:hypothetical protein
VGVRILKLGPGGVPARSAAQASNTDDEVPVIAEVGYYLRSERRWTASNEPFRPVDYIDLV